MFILKIVFLFLAIFFTLVNYGKMVYRDKSGIPVMNVLLQSIGIVGFIVMQVYLR